MQGTYKLILRTAIGAFLSILWGNVKYVVETWNLCILLYKGYLPFIYTYIHSKANKSLLFRSRGIERLVRGKKGEGIAGAVSLTVGPSWRDAGIRKVGDLVWAWDGRYPREGVGSRDHSYLGFTLGRREALPSGSSSPEKGVYPGGIHSVPPYME